MLVLRVATIDVSLAIFNDITRNCPCNYNSQERVWIFRSCCVFSVDSDRLIHRQNQTGVYNYRLLCKILLIYL